MQRAHMPSMTDRPLDLQLPFDDGFDEDLLVDHDEVSVRTPWTGVGQPHEPFQLSLAPTPAPGAGAGRSRRGLSPREEWARSIVQRAHAPSMTGPPASVPAHGAAASRHRQDIAAAVSEMYQHGRASSSAFSPCGVDSKSEPGRQSKEVAHVVGPPPLQTREEKAHGRERSEPLCSESLMETEHVKKALQEIFDGQGAALEQLLQDQSASLADAVARRLADRAALAAADGDFADSVAQKVADIMQRSVACDDGDSDQSKDGLEERAADSGEERTLPVSPHRWARTNTWDNVHKAAAPDHKRLDFARHVVELHRHKYGEDRAAWPQGHPQLVEYVSMVDRHEAGAGGLDDLLSVDADVRMDVRSEGRRSSATSATSTEPTSPETHFPMSQQFPGAFGRGARKGSPKATSHPSSKALSFLRSYCNKGEESRATRFWDMVESYLFQVFSRLEEPPRHRCIDRIVHSHVFEMLTILVILFNMYVVWQSTNYEMDPSIGLPFSSDWTTALEWSFVAYYSVELCLRIASHGIYFILGPQRAWNLFDSGLLCLALFNTIARQTMRDWVVLRTLRVLRIARVIRAVHLLQLVGLEDLMLMLTCVLGSFSQLFWSICLIAFVDFLFGIFFVQVMAGHVEYSDAPVTPRQKADILEHFGSVEDSMITLIMCTTGGQDWIVAYHILGYAGFQAQLLFLFFVLFNTVSLWNVITSTFVEKALKLAKPTSHALVIQAQQEEFLHAQELYRLFKKADTDRNNKISKDEFMRFCEKPEFITFLRMRGVDIKEVPTFYAMLLDAVGDVNEKEVEIEALVAICLRIRGQATSVDLHTMRYELQKLRTRCENMRKLVKGVHRVSHSSGRRTSQGSQVARPPSTEGSFADRRSSRDAVPSGSSRGWATTSISPAVVLPGDGSTETVL